MGKTKAVPFLLEVGRLSACGCGVSRGALHSPLPCALGSLVRHQPRLQPLASPCACPPRGTGQAEGAGGRLPRGARLAALGRWAGAAVATACCRCGGAGRGWGGANGAPAPHPSHFFSAVASGKLVTGQNPASSKRVAELVIEAVAPGLKEPVHGKGPGEGFHHR